MGVIVVCTMSESRVSAGDIVELTFREECGNQSSLRGVVTEEEVGPDIYAVKYLVSIDLIEEDYSVSYSENVLDGESIHRVSRPYNGAVLGDDAEMRVLE